MSKTSKKVQRRADAKRAGQRTRNWALIFYPEDLPEDWKEQVDGLHVKWVEGPLHDRDVNADGTPKKPHVHTLFMFENVKHEEQVMDLFRDLFGQTDTGSVPGVPKPQQVSDRGAVVRYMAHMDNPDKAQYDVKDIIGHNGADPAELLRYSATETRQMIIAMEEFIEQEGIVELSDFSAAIRYDRPEWHDLLATKMTTYFNAFIRSRRHKLETQQPAGPRFPAAPRNLGEPPLKVDPDTGEVIAGGDDVNGEA